MAMLLLLFIGVITIMLFNIGLENSLIAISGVIGLTTWIVVSTYLIAGD